MNNFVKLKDNLKYKQIKCNFCLVLKLKKNEDESHYIPTLTHDDLQ